MKLQRKCTCGCTFAFTFFLVLIVRKIFSEQEVLCENAALPKCDNLGFFERLQFSYKIGRKESVCSRKATLRGPGQKVVSFSLFGDIINTEGRWSWYAKVDKKNFSTIYWLSLFRTLLVTNGLKL